MKETDNWKTPKWLMQVFNNFFDPCPMDFNQPPHYPKDCLHQDWPQNCYVNPPYSNPLPFVLKAIEQHKKSGGVIILLLKLDTTTKWFKALADAGAHFLFFAERLHYSDKDSAPFPSVLAILSDAK